MNKLTNLGIITLLNVALLGCGGNDQNTSNTVATNNPANVNSMNTNGTSRTANSNQTAVVQATFWESAARGGMAEVALSNLALSKSQNADVRNFAQMMITDHTKAGNELKELAAKKKVALPTQLGDSQGMLEDLNRLSNADFDKEYVEAMVDDHEDTVELFKNEAENSKDAELKAFAAKTLPTLQNHLRMIRDVQSKMQ
jgi:putative membrane protein